MKTAISASSIEGAPAAVKKRVTPLRRFWSYRTLVLMCVPAILFFLVMSYLPMPGLYLAFINYNYTAGIFGSQFVGFDNFKFLVTSGALWKLTFNTIAYNLAFIFFGNILQIGIAILLNELRKKWFKKLSQSLMFLPFFISFVLVGLIAYNILSYDFGLLNGILKSIGWEPLKTYSNPTIWPFIIVFTFLWQSTGYGSIVYFAAIMGLDSEIVEAAEIDGANALQRIRYIVLPWLKPTFIILLLFSLGGILRGNFGLFYNLVGANNTALFDATDIIETFVFRSLMNNFNFSLGSAVSLYQSVFGFFIVITANWLVKKVSPENTLF
ncbi:ABC transporter permease subunit [Paenibacillus alginolyticus]|uniref:ABC transporter permease subunit n=1 Tax=Paenibacillus alginolyticus TaxID=59839 RepID=A0ABT4GBW7_9BACL|nr:ABC transporter permease subunit [Paenibacillus alginolyticus]MCY9669303.1 ABC transporter permease subunit [Paenibacillus alginolyticus]MCY9693682.1 ABC transporter permease subunit [Paenibacillus alginolyticus]MEC0145588.1 ABC transporter permease subunit [Paenibacillus alginolyticus]